VTKIGLNVVKLNFKTLISKKLIPQLQKFLGNKNFKMVPSMPEIITEIPAPPTGITLKNIIWNAIDWA
jgi:hypothetical protein